jgi:hypothetical protein
MGLWSSRTVGTRLAAFYAAGTVGPLTSESQRHQPGRLRAVNVLGGEKDLVEAAAGVAGFDGVPQREKFAFSETPGVPNGRSVAADFEVVGVASARREDRFFFQVTRTRPHWIASGPVYPIGAEEGQNVVAGEVPVPSGVTTGGTRGAGAFRDSEGKHYGHYNTGDDRHGTTWPTEWGAESRLVKWDAKGNLRWLVDRVEWMGTVWTKDGLYVGNFLDGRVDDGTVYWFTQGRNSIPTYKVHGWDGWPIGRRRCYSATSTTQRGRWTARATGRVGESC